MATPGWITLYARSHLQQAERELSLLSINSNKVPMDVLIGGMEHIAEQARRKYDWGIEMSLEEQRLCSNIYTTFADLAMSMKKWDAYDLPTTSVRGWLSRVSELRKQLESW